MSTEPLLLGPEAAPSLVGAAVRIGAVLLLLFGGALAWMHWQRRGRGARRRLEVLDRVMLARGASVALLRVEGHRLLVGVSAEGVRLIRRLDDAVTDEPAPGATRFPEVLARVSARGGRDR